MKNFLVRWLVIPLGLSALVSMLVSLCVPDPWRSLLVNLAATFLGSILTVFFVERVLRREEEQRWQKFQRHVGKQVTVLAIGAASSVRIALSIPPPDPRNDREAPTLAQIGQMTITMIEDDLLHSIERLWQMDQDDWRIFAANLAGAMRNCELLLSLFGTKLDAEIAVLVLDLHEKAREVRIPYEVIPDLLGVPLEQLKPNRRGESTAPLVRSWLRLATTNVEELLRICVTLLQETAKRFPERN